MDQVLTDNIWKQIATKARKEKRRLAAIAYITSADFLKFNKGDILVCDASDHAIMTGQTSAAVLKLFFNAGAQLYSNTNLHSKVLVFGQRVLIGSCNLSNSSATTLREAALLSSRSSIRSQAVAFIHKCKEEGKAIDNDFIKRLLRIKVIKHKPSHVPKRHRTQSFGNRTWVLRTYQLDSEKYKDEEKLINKAEKDVKQRLSDPESEISWIRWVGRSRFRETAKKGDTIIVMNSTKWGKHIVVSPPVPILKRQDHGKWTRFYYELQQDSKEISWTEFDRSLKKVGIGSIQKNSIRELTRRDAALVDTIWEEAE